MKNIQEILLKCGGIGKLILGDEEIDVSVNNAKSKVHHIDGYTDVYNKKNDGTDIVFTTLDVTLCGDDFCKAGD